MSVERRVAAITGASQGIGAELVRAFLERGYRVVANSRSIKPDASAEVLAIAGDIADPAVAERVISGAVEKFGRVDTLVNNAGIFIGKPFTEYTEADFARDDFGEPGRVLLCVAAGRAADARAGRRAHREHHDDAGGSAA